MAGPEPRPKSTKVELVSVSDNGDGTATVRKRLADGTVEERTMQLEVAEQMTAERPQVEVLGRAIGKGMQDCTWCRYGKPALGGAVVGLGLATVAGMEPVRGLVWGGVGGLFYGHMRG